MNLTPYQLLVPLVAFVAVAYAWNLVSRRQKTAWEAGLWTIFWLCIGVIAIYPDAVDILQRFLGIKNRENAVFITAIGILFMIVFYLIIRLENLEQRQTKLIRRMALKDSGIDK